MRWTHVVVAAALAFGAAPAGAGGAGGSGGAPSAGGAGGVPGAGAAPAAPAGHAEWLREHVRLRAGLGPSAADAEELGFHAALVSIGAAAPGGDRFVDHRVRLVWEPGQGLRTYLRLDAYSASGTALWSHDVPAATHVYTVPAKVGVAGGRGLLVAAYEDTTVDAGVVRARRYDLRLTAYAADGGVAWTRTFPGVATGSGRAGTRLEDVLRTATHGADRMLVMTRAGAPDTAEVTQPAVVDGATGAVRPIGEPLRDAPSAWAGAAGDLDRDGYADAFVRPAPAERVRALSSGTGATLWTTAVPRHSYHVTPLPDVTGDGVDDFSLMASPGGGGPAAWLYSGADGGVAWSRPGHAVYAIGDADGDDGSEVVVTGQPDGGQPRATAAAYAATGLRLWASTTRVLADGGFGRPWSPERGEVDVDADGVADLPYRVVPRDARHAEHGVLDGRTGRRLRTAYRGAWFTAAALDGTGSDAVRTAWRDGGLTVTAWQGATARRLWTVSLPAARAARSVTATNLGDDGCDDLVITLGARDGVFTDVVVSGATGTPAWALSRSSGDAEVSVPAPTAHRVARGCPPSEGR